MISVTASHKSMLCQVHFFKGWATYNHPVTPVDPVGIEEALARDDYYRGWICRRGNEDLFSLFEGVKLSRTELQGIVMAEQGGQRFYRVDRSKGQLKPGAPIGPAETVMLNEFLHVMEKDGQSTVQLVTQKVRLKYDYEYAASGALRKVSITNPLGETNVLDYQ